MATDPTALLMQLVNAGGNAAGQFQQGQQDAQQQAGGLQRLQAGAMQLQQAGQQQQAEQQYQSDVQAFVNAPVDQKAGMLSRMIVQHPEYAKQFQASYDAMAAPQRESHALHLYELWNAAKGGSGKIIAAKIDQIMQAEGNKDPELADLRDKAASGDPDALNQITSYAQGHLAFAAPDQAKALGVVGDTDGNEFSNTPQGDIYSKRTGDVTHAGTVKPVIKTVNGQIVQVYPDGTTAPAPHPSAASGDQIEQLAMATVPGATVTSRSRTTEHNADVGGVPNSYHLSNQARDLVPPSGMSMADFSAQLTAAMPGLKVLNEGTHVHVQPTGPAPKFNAGGTKVLYTAPPKPSAAATLDAPTRVMMAQQYLAGDKTVLQNLGRSGANTALMRQEIQRQASARGMNGAQIAAQMADFTGTMAAERAAGTRTANVELASTEAQRLIPLALKASADLPRNGFLPFAKAQQKIQSGTNDPRLRRFVTANNALVNVYSRAVSPTGQPTVSDKEHARELLNTAYDQPSYQAVVSQMQQEITAARAAPRDVRADLRAQVGAGQQGSQPTQFARNPKTGQRLGLVGGKWVPVR